MVLYEFDRVSFSLRRKFDFGFLKDYGDVFSVFAKQDSGNICFGVDNGKMKLFLKIAGAETECTKITPNMAEERMKRTSVVYEELRHPNLLNIIEHRSIPGGYMQVFEWFNGLCMGKQYGHTQRFLALPEDEKLDIFKCILDFHSHVNKLGYVAIDFYDGSIMYDFDKKQTRICDIEFYSQMPYVNTMGRMWGSGRFMSPEEFTLGAQIDRRSNVFTMGATAFQLFGGGTERDRKLWQLSDARYETCRRATDPDPERRFRTIDELIQEWQ